MTDQKWPADKVERRAVAELIPYARNSRTHSEEQVGQIAASIKEWGWTVPVLIEPNGGLIAGHGRILAAQKLGIKDVPCMVAEGWTDAQKKAYVIADNKLALNSGWDQEMLRVELRELEALDFDLTMTGFDLDEISALGFDDESEIEMPEIAEGDREPFQQMTFTLHDDQAEQVKEAMDKARAMGGFEDTQNDNGNGNALARVCETFNGIS